MTASTASRPTGAPLPSASARSPKKRSTPAERSTWCRPTAARPRAASPLGLDSAPRWSPDGRRLAFLSDRHERGKPALYVMPVDGGAARRLVTERGEAADPQWSPDGSRISFLLKEIDSAEEEQRKKEQRDDAIVVDDDKFTRLWVVDVASRAVTRLSPEGMNVWMQAWSPAGDRIAVIHSPSPRENDYYRALTLSTLAAQPADDAARAVTMLCHVYGDTVASLYWSPDGTRLAFVGPQTQQPDSLAVDVPLIVVANGGGAPRPALSGHPAQLSWVAWLCDDELAAAGDEGLGAVFYRLRLDGSAPAPLFPGGQPAHGAPRQLSLGQNRATLAYTREDTTTPGDVWAARAGGDPVRLTTLNPALQEMAWGAVEAVSWRAADGLEIQGLLIKPVGYEPGKRYPTVVHVHGGPAWLWSDRFYAGWHDWDQLLAGRGYAVLMPNPRGSTGRGTPFMRGNIKDFGGGEWQDVLAGAHWAIESGIADPERMGLGGWSWGGYLTAWGVTQTDLFKAAVAGAGPTNLVSDHGQNNIPDMNRLYFDDLPYGDATPYWDRSPMKYVA